MKELQAKSKAHYDKTARRLPPLKTGESVHVQKNSLWEPANIISQHNEHSYNVRTPAGAMYCRNSKILNITPQTSLPQSTSQQNAKRITTDTSAKSRHQI